MSISAELQTVDIKDIGTWPIYIQLSALIGVVIAIIGLGYIVLLGGQWETYQNKRTEEEQLKTLFIEKKRKAVNLDAYKQQLFEIQQSFGALLKQLPTKAEMETLITEINQSGVGRGLSFELFKPAPNETKTDGFAERPIEIRLIGNYHDLAAFASDVSQLPRIVTLTDMRLKNSSGSGLQLEANARTYRALDLEESLAFAASQKKTRK